MSEFGAYRGQRVLLTGHTGFKGSWLSLWLVELGADVVGVALNPHTDPSLFVEARVAQGMEDFRCDIRDRTALQDLVRDVAPDVVFHLAAQPIVRRSYEMAIETFETNVMGSVHLFEALRASGRHTALVHVSTDKCYENREDGKAYVETDRLGGHDPYSASKAAAEIALASYQDSFFKPGDRVMAASGRAGNVIGGGDWAEDRIVPDTIRALLAGVQVEVRNPSSTRPWQHVLEALSGYLTVGLRLMRRESDACRPWNFGPPRTHFKEVRHLVDELIAAWGSGEWVDVHDPASLHEASVLRLNCDQARDKLGWAPRWGFEETARRTANWFKKSRQGEDARELCRRDIIDYMKAGPAE